METQITGDNTISPELQTILSTIPEEAKQDFVAEMKRDILRELAYDDFPSFCEYCFKDTEKREGEFIVLRDFHREWCELLKTENRLNLFSPCDFGKTSLITTAYPIWRLGRYANTRIVLISATYSQAVKYLSEIKDNILDNRFVKEVFPDLKPLPDKIYKNRPSKWSEDAITVTRSLSMRDYSVQALGIGGPILGARIDVMILDDVVTLQNSASIKLRQKMIEWFDSTALKRLTKDSQCIFVSTAWYEQDLPHYLVDKADWTTVKYSALPEDKALGYRLASWPERYSEERLAGMRAHNEREFNRTMRNIAKTSDAYPFAAYVEGMLGDFKRDDSWKHIIGMDLSTKKREGTTIIVVAYSLATGRKVIVDVEYGAWKSSVKKAKLKQYYNKYLPDRIVVEANSLQDDIVDDYKELKGNDGKRLPVKGVITTSSMKDVALVNLEEEFEEGMWKIAYRNNPHFERLKKELELYPDYKTTDGVMALLFCSVMLGGRRNKSGNIRVSVIGTDGKVAHSTKKHKYDFSDYRLFNTMMQRAGTDIKMPKNYPEIADWIKKYQKYDEVDMTRKPDLVEDKDYRIVLNEMISFVKALREVK